MSFEEGSIRTKQASRKTATEVFKEGDHVALTNSALKSGPRMMGPLKFYSIGWPNCFDVTAVKDDSRGGQILWIDQCCKKLLMNRKHNAILCHGHDAKWFRMALPSEIPDHESKPEESRPRNPGDRAASISLPFLGEVSSLKYFHDEVEPRIVLNVAGKELEFKGKLARDIHEIAKDNGVL